MTSQRQRIVPVLLAGLLAAAGAHAQHSSSATTSNVPLKAGEASTMTQGVPNLKANNRHTTTGSSATYGPHSGAATMGNTDSDTSRVPLDAGQASTMVNGRPNAIVNDPRLTKSDEQIRAEKELKRAQARTARELAVMGQRGATAGAPAGTPAISPAGNPSVFEGGTPK